MATLTGELAKVVSTRDIPELKQEIKEALVSDNLKSLSNGQKSELLDALCQSVGLNPLSQPFIIMEVRESQDAPTKHKVYATRDCTEQLRKIYQVNAKKTGTRQNEEVYMVDVEVSDNTGRIDFATGVVGLRNRYGPLKGDRLANAIMRCETKAKRRATLSICGLGFLDETETDTHDAVPLGGNSEPSELPNVPEEGQESKIPESQEKWVCDEAKRTAIMKLVPVGDADDFCNFLEWSSKRWKIDPPVRGVVDIPNQKFYDAMLKALQATEPKGEVKIGEHDPTPEFVRWKNWADNPYKQAKKDPETKEKENKARDEETITMKQSRELLSLLDSPEQAPLFKDFLAYVSKEVWKDDPPIRNTSAIKVKNLDYMREALAKDQSTGESGFTLWLQEAEGGVD